VPGRNRWLGALRVELAEYFAGKRQQFDLPLVIRGTPFQERVWQALLTIPYGDTWSYRDLAERIGQSGATRAVGTANGMNRIAIVIRASCRERDGRLGGYGGASGASSCCSTRAGQGSLAVETNALRRDGQVPRAVAVPPANTSQLCGRSAAGAPRAASAAASAPTRS